jgi:ERCC4-type nuclease
MLLVDSREGSRDLSIPLRSEGLEAELAELEYADVCWMGQGPGGLIPVGVELKTVRDLLSSMRSGRLAGRQIPGMLASYDYSYLLVEGVFRPNPQTGVLEEPRRGGWQELRLGASRFYYDDVELFLTSLDTLTPLRVRRTRSRTETIRAILLLYRWWQKPWEDHGSLKVLYGGPPPSPLPVEHSLLRKFAVQLPGVGWERSAAVERSFSSVAEAVSANESRWRQIDGIGKVLSRRIVNAIHNRTSTNP